LNSSVTTILSNTEKFKALAKIHYKIEAKNSELKNRHGCEAVLSVWHGNTRSNSDFHFSTSKLPSER
jgi:hypothetical protein